MLSNQRAKVAIFLTKASVGTQVETSLGAGAMVPYDDFDKIFKLSKELDCDDFLTLDEDRCAIGFGSLSAFPRNKPMRGYDSQAYLDFWIFKDGYYYGV